jgi:exopolysaccharide biosynthesis polyprenyl glycosylphosphotransferase
MNEKKQISKYIVWDIISSWISWVFLYLYRKSTWENTPTKISDLRHSTDPNLFLGIILIPVFWVTLYFLLGHYKMIFRRHRLKELGDVIVASFVGSILLFFVTLLDDQLPNYKSYYFTLSFLFGVHLIATLLGRLYLTSKTVKRIHYGTWGFKTLIIGGNQRAVTLYDEMFSLSSKSGHQFVGFLKMNGRDDLLTERLPLLGKMEHLTQIIQEKQIQEVIVALESSDHQHLQELLNILMDFDVDVSIIPDTYDLLSGSVKLTGLYGVPLVRIQRDLMPTWQVSLKRLMDVVMSTMAMLILSPVYLGIAIAVKLSSEGPVFYSQERVGKHGKKFSIYKFRTMIVNAEFGGPQLSSNFDNRITPVGKFLRKTRLDEIPQFLHVLLGEMSLVGPRPEREYYINQIKQRAPHVKHLLRVRPGITSWGQVKYGYAENVEQMVQRLKYDILYIENMSLAMDIKILFYTIVTVLRGSGK